MPAQSFKKKGPSRWLHAYQLAIDKKVNLNFMVLWNDEADPI